MLVDGVHFDAASMSPPTSATARPPRACPTWRRWVPSRSACSPPSASRPARPLADLAAGMTEHGVMLAAATCPQPGLGRVGHRPRPGRAAGAALGRPPRRPARRHGDARRPGRERLHGPGHAAAGRGPRAGGGRHRHARPLRRHRHRRAPARRGLGDGRGGRARAACRERPGATSSRPRPAARTTSSWPRSRRTCRCRSRSPSSAGSPTRARSRWSTRRRRAALRGWDHFA